LAAATKEKPRTAISRREYRSFVRYQAGESAARFFIPTMLIYKVTEKSRSPFLTHFAKKKKEITLKTESRSDWTCLPRSAMRAFTLPTFDASW
jgi:hypothetical protein